MPCRFFFQANLLLPNTAQAQDSLSRCNYDLYGVNKFRILQIRVFNFQFFVQTITIRRRRQTMMMMSQIVTLSLEPIVINKFLRNITTPLRNKAL